MMASLGQEYNTAFGEILERRSGIVLQRLAENKDIPDMLLTNLSMTEMMMVESHIRSHAAGMPPESGENIQILFKSWVLSEKVKNGRIVQRVYKAIDDKAVERGATEEKRRRQAQ